MLIGFYLYHRRECYRFRAEFQRKVPQLVQSKHADVLFQLCEAWWRSRVMQATSTNPTTMPVAEALTQAQLDAFVANPLPASLTQLPSINPSTAEQLTTNLDIRDPVMLIGFYLYHRRECYRFRAAFQRKVPQLVQSNHADVLFQLCEVWVNANMARGISAAGAQMNSRVGSATPANNNADPADTINHAAPLAQFARFWASVQAWPGAIIIFLLLLLSAIALAPPIHIDVLPSDHIAQLPAGSPGAPAQVQAHTTALTLSSPSAIADERFNAVLSWCWGDGWYASLDSSASAAAIRRRRAVEDFSLRGSASAMVCLIAELTTTLLTLCIAIVFQLIYFLAVAHFFLGIRLVSFGIHVTEWFIVQAVDSPVSVLVSIVIVGSGLGFATRNRPYGVTSSYTH